jgi:DsbE subfamily thiol:disulfide oxidoreductase
VRRAATCLLALALTLGACTSDAEVTDFGAAAPDDDQPALPADSGLQLADVEPPETVPARDAELVEAGWPEAAAWIRREADAGRPVVVNFWASWCGPCVEEFPLLREAAARHADAGLVVVGVVYQDRSEAARDFMARHGATWAAAMDPGERVSTAYGILGPPETFFIGRDGRISARQFGQFSAASLEEKIAAIIDEE